MSRWTAATVIETAAAAVKSAWTYADARYFRCNPFPILTRTIFRALGTSGLAARNPSTGRELMAPVKFAHACAACHLLMFDRAF